jgi:hypothetical protein
VITVLGFVNIILIMVFTYFLKKKSDRNENIKNMLALFGSLFFAGLAVFVARAILEGFFLE